LALVACAISRWASSWRWERPPASEPEAIRPRRGAIPAFRWAQQGGGQPALGRTDVTELDGIGSGTLRELRAPPSNRTSGGTGARKNPLDVDGPIFVGNRCQVWPRGPSAPSVYWSAARVLQDGQALGLEAWAAERAILRERAVTPGDHNRVECNAEG
jgi:hypothetical protein